MKPTSAVASSSLGWLVGGWPFLRIFCTRVCLSVCIQKCFACISFSCVVFISNVSLELAPSLCVCFWFVVTHGRLPVFIPSLGINTTNHPLNACSFKYDIANIGQIFQGWTLNIIFYRHGHWIAGACRVFWWQSFSFDNSVSSAVVTPGLPCSQPWGWSDIAGETAKTAKLPKWTNQKSAKRYLTIGWKNWSGWRALTSHDQLQREIEESIDFHKISHIFCNQVSRFPHSQPSIKVSDLKIWATWLTSASHAILDMATEVDTRTPFLFGYIFFYKTM